MAKDKRKERTSAADLLKLYYTSQEKPEEEPAVIPKPVVTPKQEKPEIPSAVIPKPAPPSREKSRREPPPPEDSKSFLDSFGSLTQYLPSVADVTEYAGRAISPTASAAYDLLPDHAQEFVKQGIQATTGIDTGPITEGDLTTSTFEAMKESAWAGLRRTGGKRSDYKDYTIDSPSDIFGSPEGFVSAAVEPKKRAGYITGRTDTFEIDPEGNLILKDKFDFGSGGYEGFGWKPKDKKRFGWLEGILAGKKEYGRDVRSPMYSKVHSLFDKKGPYPWSGALNTSRDIRINLGPAPPDIKKLLARKKNNPDPVESSLGANTQ